MNGGLEHVPWRQLLLIHSNYLFLHSGHRPGYLLARTYLMATPRLSSVEHTPSIVTMVASVTTLFVATLLLQASSSAVYSQQDRNCNGSICLTSFQWCDDSACDFPDGTLAVNSIVDSSDYVVLLHSDRDYNITWKNYDITQPVQVTWTLKSTVESAPSVQWVTSEFSCQPSH